MTTNLFTETLSEFYARINQYSYSRLINDNKAVVLNDGKLWVNWRRHTKISDK